MTSFQHGCVSLSTLWQAHTMVSVFYIPLRSVFGFKNFFANGVLQVLRCGSLRSVDT